MKSFAAFALAGVASATASVDAVRDTIAQHEFKFMNYIAQWGKSYASIEEYEHRFANFIKKEKWITEVNSDLRNTYTVGHNDFSDMTEEEYNQRLGYDPTMWEEDQSPIYGQVSNYPTSIDWRSQGAVGVVKNQGGCGDCWIFSGTAGLESYWKIKHGSLPNLAEQQCLDCCTQGNKCNGGVAGFVYNYAITNYVMKTSDYPYTHTPGTCKYKGSGLVKIQSYSRLAAGSLATHKTRLASGPVSVSLDAGGAFGSYTGGIINSNCGTNINHAVLAVGYTSDYYIIKNSWGSNWGESGFARIKITGDGDGMCGIQKQSVGIDY